MYLLFTGTTVMSDMWAAYSNLQQMGYAHMTFNHTLNFVDPVTHATTNHIESIWQKAKQAHKRRYGTHRNLLSTYMAEFMWRRKFPEKAFEQLLVDIRQQYPLGENL